MQRKDKVWIKYKKTKICFKYQKGNCTEGRNCRFLHENPKNKDFWKIKFAMNMSCLGFLYGCFLEKSSNSSLKLFYLCFYRVIVICFCS